MAAAGNVSGKRTQNQEYTSSNGRSLLRSMIKCTFVQVVLFQRYSSFKMKTLSSTKKNETAATCASVGCQKSIPLCQSHFLINKVSPNPNIKTLFEFKTWLYGRYEEMVPNIILYLHKYVIPKREINCLPLFFFLFFLIINHLFIFWSRLPIHRLLQ